MKLTNLTAFTLLLFASALSFSACENDDELAKTNVYAKTNIIMSGAQVVPVAVTSGLGSLDVNYSKANKLLTYRITWSGLTDSVIAIRLNAPAPVSYSAVNTAFPAWTLTAGFRPFADTTTPYTYMQQFTNGVYAAPSLGNVAKGLYGPNGTYTGTLAVDGIKVKESDLLNGFYYVTIHTKTFIGSPANVPASVQYRWYGELRAQIVFQ
ncbi:MAG TPA: CHRD domain-containing protein [Chitinophagaceae bacterium]